MRPRVISASVWFFCAALFVNAVAADMVVQACFSPQGKCAAHILREIGSAKKELLVAVYAFTSDDLASALVQAKKRGVAVQVVIDRKIIFAGSYNWTYSAESSNDENLLLFRDAGPLAEEYRKAFLRLWERKS